MRILSINAHLKSPYIKNSDFLGRENLSQYDALIVDPVSFEGLLGKETFTNAELKQAFSSQIEEVGQFLRNGGIIVCFFRRLIFTENEVSNYSWLFSSSDEDLRNAIAPYYGAQTAETNQKIHPIETYLNLRSLKYEAHWTGSKTDLEVLAKSKLQEPLALRIQRPEYGGEVLLVPPSSVDASRNLVRCIREAKSSDLTKEKSGELPPEWMITAPTHEYTQNLDEHLKILSNKRFKLDEQISLRLHEKSRFKNLGGLLWGSGVDVLEPAVSYAFSLLGFKVSKWKIVDLVIDSSVGKAFVEIEGTEGIIKVRKGDQLLRYLTEPGKDGIKGVVVGNAFRLEPPNTRPPSPQWFSRELKELAQIKEFALITTLDLYDLVGKVLLKKLSKKTLQKIIMETKGVFTTSTQIEEI